MRNRGSSGRTGMLFGTRQQLDRIKPEWHKENGYGTGFGSDRMRKRDRVVGRECFLVPDNSLIE